MAEEPNAWGNTLDSTGGPFGPVATSPLSAVSATAYPEQGATAPLGVWDPLGLVRLHPRTTARPLRPARHLLLGPLPQLNVGTALVCQSVQECFTREACALDGRRD